MEVFFGGEDCAPRGCAAGTVVGCTDNPVSQPVAVDLREDLGGCGASACKIFVIALSGSPGGDCFVCVGTLAVDSETGKSVDTAVEGVAGDRLKFAVSLFGDADDRSTKIVQKFAEGSAIFYG